MQLPDAGERNYCEDLSFFKVLQFFVQVVAQFDETKHQEKYNATRHVTGCTPATQQMHQVTGVVS
jgi:hypothetical protein